MNEKEKQLRDEVNKYNEFKCEEAEKVEANFRFAHMEKVFSNMIVHSLMTPNEAIDALMKLSMCGFDVNQINFNRLIAKRMSRGNYE